MAKIKITNSDKKASKTVVNVFENGAIIKTLAPGKSAEVNVTLGKIVTVTETAA